MLLWSVEKSNKLALIVGKDPWVAVGHLTADLMNLATR